MIPRLEAPRPRATAVRRACALLLVVAVSACSLKDTFSDLFAVNKALMDRFGGQYTLNINNGVHLTIGIVNADDKADTKGSADSLLVEIARTAYVAYPKRDRLTRLTLQFVSVKSIGFGKATTTTTAKTFTGDELRALGAEPAPAPPAAPDSSRDTSRDATRAPITPP